MSDDRELGLETLLEVRTKLGISLDDNLLTKCFKIQKKYQFNQDRTLSKQAMDRLIEDCVNNVGGKHTED